MGDGRIFQKISAPLFLIIKYLSYEPDPSRRTVSLMIKETRHWQYDFSRFLKLPKMFYYRGLTRATYILCIEHLRTLRLSRETIPGPPAPQANTLSKEPFERRISCHSGSHIVLLHYFILFQANRAISKYVLNSQTLRVYLFESELRRLSDLKKKNT